LQRTSLRFLEPVEPSRCGFQVVDPNLDPRWQRFVDCQANSSIFHTTGWLQCLRRTYGFQPLVFTTAAPGQEIQIGVVFCAIHSWLTGARLVSLPFSDHCEPLANHPTELSSLLGMLQSSPAIIKKQRYMELRPLDTQWAAEIKKGGFAPAGSFISHQLDLGKGSALLYRHFHKDCIQRKIRRAESAGIRVEEGRSQHLLKDFYRLHLLTRRRHGQVPQPYAWFRNMTEDLGPSMQVRVAYKGIQPLAAIITLKHSDRVVYKYGASDATQNMLGGNQLLFWDVIQESCRQGLREFDLGRTDCDNPGLAIFKERWGATRRDLVYWRSPAKVGWQGNQRRFEVVKKILAVAPTALLRAAGALFYRHAG
jgi:CelD/BcsL family acetyltransferase involved in cellulose biosynthesis